MPRPNASGRSSGRGRRSDQSGRSSSRPERSAGRGNAGKRNQRSDKSGRGSFSKKRDEFDKPSRQSSTSDNFEKRPRRSSTSEKFDKPSRRSSNSDKRGSSPGRNSSSERTSGNSRPYSKKTGSYNKRDEEQRGSGPFNRRTDDRRRDDNQRSDTRPKRFDKSKDSGERGFFKKSKSRFSDKPSKGRFSDKQSKDSKTQIQPDLKPAAQTEKVRLNKFIANSGVCSRREADELISMGLISVNGQTITELGFKVNPGDEVRYENRVLRAEKPVYILMNKPKGFLTTTEDPQERNTVMQIIGSNVKERIYPVGRLDRNTTGLLLLTNDGDLAEKLMHPSYNVKKIYKVELDRPLTKADFQTISEGVLLEEGRAMVDDLAIVSPDGKTVGLEIHIGWNRVVRRIFEALQYEVHKLDRTVYAGLDKKDLGRGQWRFLTKDEIVRLKHLGAK